MSQDSHTKLIDPPMHQMDTFQNIQADQADLKQPNAKQQITELESDDEHMQRPMFSSYRHSGKTSKVAEPSRTYKRLQYSIQGDSNSHPPSSSYLPRSLYRIPRNMRDKLLP